MSKAVSIVAALLLTTVSAVAGVRVSDVGSVDKFTGRGNRSEVLLRATLTADGSDSNESLHAVTLSLEGSDRAGDIGRIVLFASDGTGKMMEIGSAKAASRNCKKGKDLRIKVGALPVCGTLLLEVCADVAADAVEGNRIRARLKSVEAGGRSVAPETEVTAEREIVLCRQLLYAPGDYGSRNWRIPALRALPDGSLLAVNDKRKHHEGDLPGDIDIVARRSEDNGRTWSQPVTIAEGRGYKQGYGDPAIAVTADGSEVICVFVGGNGLWASRPDDPQRSYVSRSADGGRTWSRPEDITHSLWGADAPNPACRAYTYSFFGSGNGLTLTRGEHAGRILFAAAMGPARNLNNHAVYSDDNGHTWQVSELAFEGGDEAKIVELTDGRLLMSVRRGGRRGYNISTDGGQTWGTQGLWTDIDTNACNGDMIRYSATDRGAAEDILLHSLPDHRTRRNVTVFISRDEGRTWPEKRTVCPYESVYSSLTVLPDGTVGIYLEENPTPAGCELWYMNFSMEWLTRGRPDNNR